MRRRIALPLAALLLAAPLVAAGPLSAGADSGTFQDHNPVVTTNGGTNATFVGQTFTASETGSLEGITIWAVGTTAGQTATLAVEGVAGGKPDGSILRSASLVMSTAGPSTAARTFLFSPALDVVAGQQYAMALGFTGNKSFDMTTNNGYVGGDFFTSWDGSFWSPLADWDMRFTTRISSPNITAPTISGAAPAAYVGVPYSFAYTLSGYPSPVTKITSGALPSGLSLSRGGVISGTPTVATSRDITITADNFGTASTSQTFVVGTPKPSAPPAPTATATLRGATVVVTPPSWQGIDAVTSYTVRATPGSATCTTPATELTCTFTTLTGGTSYTFAASATNSAGASPNSVPSDSVVPFSEPAAPGNVVATLGDSEADLTWDAAAANGKIVTGYALQYAIAGTGDWQNGGTSVTLGATISPLVNGTTYDVQVRAQNSAGWSPWSSSASVKPGRVPGAPTNVVASPDDTAVGVQWDAPTDNGGRSLEYVVQYREVGATTWLDSAAAAPTTRTVIGLTNATEYQLRVIARSELGDAYSAIVLATPRAVPDAPVLGGSSGLPNELYLTWSDSAPHGTPVTGYEIEYRETGTTTWLPGDTTTTLLVSITGVTNGTSYELRVRATSAAGPSDWSETATVVPADVPSAPVDFVAWDGDESSDLEWAAPLSDGGFAVTSYDIQYRVVGAGTWIGVIPAGGLSDTINGLTNSTRYEFQVRARNAIGAGPWATSGATAWGFHPHFETPAGVNLAGGTVNPGDTVVLRGDGALPGEEVFLTLHSTPVVLGSTTVALDGTYRLVATIPLNTEVGSHSLEASHGGGEGSLNAGISFTVNALPQLVTSGTEAMPFVGFALLAMLAGAGLLVIRRRRVAQ